MRSTTDTDRPSLIGILAIIAAGLLASSALTACNTGEGIGEDLGELGESIEDAAD